MKGKLAVLAGMGAGYVLGTRAGRQRYEQIMGTARRLWEDPRVTEKRQQAAHVAREQGSAAKDKVQQTVQEKIQEHRDSRSSGSSGASPSTNPAGSAATPNGTGGTYDPS